MSTEAIALDPWREVDALPLLIRAQREPLAVLRALAASDGLLAQAIALAGDEFDPMAAAERARTASALLGLIASELKSHATTPPYGRPGRKQIKAATEAFERDAGSAAWQEI